jgi:hypothetical protein
MTYFKLGLFLLMLATSSEGSSKGNSQSYRGVNINFAPDITPTKGDWQRFHTLTESELKRLWQHHTSQGLALGGWAWQWRISWIRACSQRDRLSWCDSILRAALSDKAVVVRGEAARAFSLAHQGHANDTDLAILVETFQRKDNFRNNEPLFVCEQILSSILGLGHPRSSETAAKLSKPYPSLKKYVADLRPRKKSSNPSKKL